MQRSSAAPAPPQARLRVRPSIAVRWFFLASVVFSLWLAVPPALDFVDAREQAAETRAKLERLTAEEQRLRRQSDELSRGSGLEEEARRLGLIDPAERSYVVEGLPQR